MPRQCSPSRTTVLRYWDARMRAHPGTNSLMTFRDNFGPTCWGPTPGFATSLWL